MTHRDNPEQARRCSMPAFIQFTFLCVFTASFTGCICRSVARYGVQGRLIDGGTGQAIASHPISLLLDDKPIIAKTGTAGEFTIPPKFRHSWTWLGGPLPASPSSATLLISCSGYTNFTKTFLDPESLRNRNNVVVEDKHILVGNVALTSRKD